MIRKAWAKDAKALKYYMKKFCIPPIVNRHGIREVGRKDWIVFIRIRIIISWSLKRPVCVVATVTFVIVENLTYQLRPYGIIENVVTHPDYQKQGYASALLQRALEIAKAAHCYKVTVATGSKKKSTLIFIGKMDSGWMKRRQECIASNNSNTNILTHLQ